ncbi:MAG: FAD/NAD(P)-binding oxidoreductase [Acidimicrobiia bacterium]
MTGSTILILGGGWGGLATAHHLRRDLAPEHRIVVVERSDTFSMCVSYLWLMNGKRQSLTQVRREMATLKRPGIEWVQAEALSLDPIDRTVDTSEGRLTGNYVVLALGAELAPDAVAGFDEAAHNLYDGAGAVGLRAALESFTGGQIVVLVAGTPFRCPAAPYEAAMLVEAELRERGIRDRTEMSFYTPEPRPMLVAGRAVSDALENMLSEKGIGYHPQHQVESIEPDTRTLHFADKTVPYDLLIGIPPHRPPALLAAAGLADDTGYVPVHPQTLEILSNLETLEVAYPGVYAIGDVTSIRLLNQLLLPKAGVFAEAQAQVVADAIASEIRGEPRSANFDGQGSCYVETGDGLAAYGSGDFYAYPEPRVKLEDPTTAARQAKEEYEQLLDAWFE